MSPKVDKRLPELTYTMADVEVHSVETKFKGFFKVNEYLMQHALFSGDQSDVFSREIFERGDAVVVMPYDVKQDKILFNEQFRPGAIKSETSPWLFEFIAGMFGENESPIDVAIREAEEEANITLTAKDLSLIMQYYSSPGGSNEQIHLYLALFDSNEVTNASYFGLPEENEDIKLHLVDRGQAFDLLAQGKITNAATIIGLQWLAMNFQSLKNS